MRLVLRSLTGMRELHDFLTGDHARLDALLRASIERGDAEAYDAFRRGLLRHIAIDGEILHMRPPLTFSVAPHRLWLMVPTDAE